VIHQSTAPTEADDRVRKEIQAGHPDLGATAAARAFAAILPSRPPEAATIWRWMTFGLRGTDGRKVILGSARFGKNLLTTAAAIDRFALAVWGKGFPESPEPPAA
jgi:hypothetical protein